MQEKQISLEKFLCFEVKILINESPNEVLNVW